MKYLNEVLYEIKNALQDVDENQLDNFVDKILKADHVVCVGAGRMGYSLRAFAMRLNHFGIPAYFVGEDTYIYPLHENDLLLISSGSGETKTIKYFLDLAKKTGCKTAVVTATPNSYMAKNTDYQLFYKGCTSLNSKEENKVNSIQVMSTLNEQSTYILFDIIAKKIWDKFPDINFKGRHFNVE